MVYLKTVEIRVYEQLKSPKTYQSQKDIIRKVYYGTKTPLILLLRIKKQNQPQKVKAYFTLPLEKLTKANLHFVVYNERRFVKLSCSFYLCIIL